MPQQLTAEQWNRTLLARQHLLDRVDEDAIEVLDRCVGLQTQDPQAPFYGLWSRIEGFEPTELDELLTDREVVRMTLLRGTLFLMDGLDARWIRGAVQPSIDVLLRQNHLRRLSATEPEAIVDLARGLFASAGDDGVTGDRLRVTLAERWPDEPVDALAAVARGRLPLVQTPPRGLWQTGGPVVYRLLDDWLGPGEPAVAGDEAVQDLIRMYLRGFGPSSAAAISTWSGLTGLGDLLEKMVADWELAEYLGPDGQRLYDLEGLPLTDGATPAPVRLIAPYDNLFLANADRARVADEALYAKTVTANGRSPGFVLVDGRLAGTWKPVDGRVRLTALRELTVAERSAVEREAAALEAFVAG